MGNLENYSAGEQMDLPGTEENKENKSGEALFNLNPEESESKKPAWQPSETGMKYEESLTREERERDNCPECGGSGDWCRLCIRKNLIPNPNSRKQ